MINTIGFIELNSIAKGIEVADHMLKVANVQLMFSTATCPGKYILIYATSAQWRIPIEAAKLLGGEFIIDDLMIPKRR
jgi:Carbon dioxide concentrating mechanism/carboxysome shell protein